MDQATSPEPKATTPETKAKKSSPLPPNVILLRESLLCRHDNEIQDPAQKSASTKRWYKIGNDSRTDVRIEWHPDKHAFRLTNLDETKETWIDQSLVMWWR